MNEQRIPLLPLHSVLFPEGPLPLKIFEPRYTDMVSYCMKNNMPFGVCLIRESNEIGLSSSTFEIGTLAKIDDWHMRNDGMLGITVVGLQRFKIDFEEKNNKHLHMAKISILCEKQDSLIPETCLHLVDLLKDCMSQTAYRYTDLPKKYTNATWVGYRLAELLPLKLAQKQYFLQLDDPIERLEHLTGVLDHLDHQV